MISLIRFDGDRFSSNHDLPAWTMEAALTNLTMLSNKPTTHEGRTTDNLAEQILLQNLTPITIKSETADNIHNLCQGHVGRRGLHVVGASVGNSTLLGF